MNPLVSVVVPVYNSSKFLNENIETLVKQTLKEIEIIYVDDGSTDDSVEIIESFQNYEKRIKLIKQKNMHAGVARNRGMQEAKGKYIIFLDSDDFFELDMLKSLYTIAEKHLTDIVVCGFYGYDEVTKSTEYTPFPNVQQGMINRSQVGRKIFEICDVIPWNKLYSREFIMNNRIQFQDLVNSNDAFFTRISVAIANNIYYLKKRFVHYRYNNVNSLQGTRERAILCFGVAYQQIKEELIKRQIFTQDIRLAYIDAVLEFIDVRFDNVVLTSNLKVLYDYLKMNLVPNLIDSIYDVPPDHIAFRLFKSSNYEEFLGGEYLFQRQKIMEMAPKTSIEYRVGRKLLRLLHVNHG